MARVPSRKSYANSPSTLAVSGRREKSRRTQRVRTTPTHSPPPAARRRPPAAASFLRPGRYDRARLACLSSFSAPSSPPLPPPRRAALSLVHACMHAAKYRGGAAPRLAAAPPTPYPAARGRAHRLPQRATTCDLPRCAKDVATPRSCHRHHFALAGPRRNRPTRFRHSCSAARDWARRVSPSAATFLLLGRVIRASAPRAGPRACVCVS